MKKVLKLFVCLTCVFSISSCSRKTFVVAPPFTDAAKIMSIRDGQTMEDVNKKLGIEPYDVLFLSGGSSVCVYNYRLKDRKINLMNSNDFHDLSAESNDRNLSSEKGQTYGTPFYSEWKKLYCTFKDGKLTDYTSITGIEDANYLLLVNGTIKLLSSKPLEFSHFTKPIHSTIFGGVGDGKATINVDTKDRDIIDGVLFPLKHDGSFKNTTPPRKKKSIFK